jgi:hypothetical protein
MHLKNIKTSCLWELVVLVLFFVWLLKAKFQSNKRGHIMLLDQEAKDAIKQAVISAIDAIALAPAQSDGDLQAQLDAANAKIGELQKKSDDDDAAIKAASESLASEIAKEGDIVVERDALKSKIEKALSDLQG